MIAIEQSTSYSYKIRDALRGGAPHHVRTPNGVVLRNKWIAESKRPGAYLVCNWVNELDKEPEYYRYYQNSPEYTFSRKRCAKTDAEKKASELNRRDGCILALVTGGVC
jgi:hypothetical protein